MSTLGGVVDAMDDTEIASAGAMQSLQFELKFLASSLRVVGERAVAELEDGVGNFLRQLSPTCTFAVGL